MLLLLYISKCKKVDEIPIKVLKWDTMTVNNVTGADTLNFEDEL